MQYHLCVYILGHAEPQNWFDPGVGSGCIPIYLVKIPFWDSYYMFWHFILTFFIEEYKVEYHKKKRPTLVFRFFGSFVKGQTNFFFLGLMWSNKCVGCWKGSFEVHYNISVYNSKLAVASVNILMGAWLSLHINLIWQECVLIIKGKQFLNA